MGRERDELEDPLDITRLEPRLQQPLGRRATDEALGAGTGVDACRLDADDAACAVRRGGRDADQRHHLLRRELRHRRLSPDRPERTDRHLCAERPLALDDAQRDVLGQLLDEERLVVDDGVDRLVEELGEARHVDALLIGGQVDGAVDRRRHHGASRGARDVHGLRHTRHARPGEADADVRLGRLEVGDDLRAVARAHAGNASGAAT